MTTAGKAVPIGIYRGRGCGISKIETYESFIGRQVTYVEDYMLEKPTTWAQFEGAYLTSGVQAGVWKGQLGTRTLALGVPACCGGSIGSGGATWRAEADGVNDTHWRALGNYLVNNGLGNSTLRIGREFNGNWYQWQVTEGGQSAYISGYQHIVTLLRGLSGANFRFNWNPTLGVGNLTSKGAESCYPGDAYVDEIGVDAYDWGTYGGSNVYTGNAATVTAAQQGKVLDTMSTMWDSLRGWYNVAIGKTSVSKGKPLTFPEWGLVLWKSGSSYLGGGDNPILVNGMGELIAGSSVSGWHAFWEDTWGAGVSDPDTLAGRPIPAPMARGAFLDWFGA